MAGVQKIKLRNFRGYIVNGEHFWTKRQLTERVRRILHSYKPYQKLKRKDFKFMLSLLQNHERANEKVGCGVKAIEVRVNTKYGATNYSFWIIRTDGSETDFSYQKCITPTSSLNLFRASSKLTYAGCRVN